MSKGSSLMSTIWLVSLVSIRMNVFKYSCHLCRVQNYGIMKSSLVGGPFAFDMPFGQKSWQTSDLLPPLKREEAEAWSLARLWLLQAMVLPMPLQSMASLTYLTIPCLSWKGSYGLLWWEFLLDFVHTLLWMHIWIGRGIQLLHLLVQQVHIPQFMANN